MITQIDYPLGPKRGTNLRQQQLLAYGLLSLLAGQQQRRLVLLVACIHPRFAQRQQEIDYVAVPSRCSEPAVLRA